MTRGGEAWRAVAGEDEESRPRESRRTETGVMEGEGMDQTLAVQSAVDGGAGWCGGGGVTKSSSDHVGGEWR